MLESFEVERKGIAERVTDLIKQRIIEGKYQVNQKLPSEREMAANLKVSRNTIREAYKILEAYGYVTIKHGTGIFVASEEEQIKKMTSSFFVTTDQMKDLFSIRKILEENSVKWAIEHSTDEQINTLAEIVAEAQAICKKNDEQGAYKLAILDQQFHITLAKLSGNTVLLRIMHNLIDLLEKVRLHSIKIPGRPAMSVKEHSNIIKAMQERNTSKAQYYMLEHLKSVEMSILENK